MAHTHRIRSILRIPFLHSSLIDRNKDPIQPYFESESSKLASRPLTRTSGRAIDSVRSKTEFGYRPTHVGSGLVTANRIRLLYLKMTYMNLQAQKIGKSFFPRLRLYSTYGNGQLGDVLFPTSCQRIPLEKNVANPTPIAWKSNFSTSSTSRDNSWRIERASILHA